MNANNLIMIIEAVNSLLSLTKQANIAWPELRARISAAEAQGRVFGKEDIITLQAKDDADSAAFDADIRKRIDNE